MIIALLLSVSIFYSLAIWGVATAATFVLICLVCLRNALKRTDPALEDERGGSELENATVYR